MTPGAKQPTGPFKKAHLVLTCVLVAAQILAQLGWQGSRSKTSETEAALIDLTRMTLDMLAQSQEAPRRSERPHPPLVERSGGLPPPPEAFEPEEPSGAIGRIQPPRRMDSEDLILLPGGLQVRGYSAGDAANTVRHVPLDDYIDDEVPLPGLRTPFGEMWLEGAGPVPSPKPSVPQDAMTQIQRMVGPEIFEKARRE